ncbi:hypothetical protein [Rhodocyclus tenuis]|uniref:Uncharacterized protein n=1 Tax=Rhodocyclus tenuis TaxID=1066 RepID=A0A840GIG8_RHOTE|nr:hypothetical protein [Rhodocyclus tenuis]MBB4247979.1 hypothetical protein [Rhodocyclus tenuis]
MEYLGIGFCLIAEAFFFNKKTLLETGKNPSRGVLVFINLFGIFFVVVGFFGTIFGAAPLFPDTHGRIILFIVFYYLLISSRLLSAASDGGGLDFLREKNRNIIDMTKIAFSIGVFPKNKPYCTFVNACQFLLILLVISFIKDLLWE